MQHRVNLSTNLLIAVKDKPKAQHCSKCRSNAMQRCKSAVIIKMAVADRITTRQNETIELMA